MALEDIDDYLFKWADLCEPLRDKCLSCGYTDCEYWQQIRDEIEEKEAK